MTREQKRRVQRARANIPAIAVLAAIFAVGVVVGRCTRAAAAQAEPAEKISVTAEPAEPIDPMVLQNIMELDEQEDPQDAQAAMPYYPLTDEDRDLVERVVMAEAGGEDYDGQRLVAQCILNAAILDGIGPDEVVEVYQYAATRPEPTESVREAVSAVFDRHDVVTNELILWFYAPARCSSEWHESQRFVLEHGGHRFFAEA